MPSCEECNGECCRYVTANIEEPTEPEDWDEIKWMLMHENVLVYKDSEDDWIVEFRTKCKNLDDDTNRCGIYGKRPDICKEHNTKDCDATEGEFANILFEKPEDVDRHLKSIRDK